MLIVLDSCEHVLAECIRLIDRLLRGCPKLSILVTSRQVLGVSAETVWRVPPLKLPDLGVVGVWRGSLHK